MRFTLGTAVWLFLIALALVMSGSFYVLATRTSEQVSKTGDELRTAAANQVRERVTTYLDQAEKGLLKLEEQFSQGHCEGVTGAESCLLTALVTNADFTEVTFVTAGDHSPLQVTVYRAPDGRVCTRQVTFAERQERTACRSAAQLLEPARAEGLPRKLEDDEDPTSSYGYSVPFEAPGRVLSTDLSQSQFDKALIRFLFLYGMPRGVLKVGLVEPKLRERIAEVHVSNEADDPFKLFLCDNQGRLITGMHPNDIMTEYDDAFRIDPSVLPPEVKLALESDARQKIDRANGVMATEGHFQLDGRPYAVSFRLLDKTQGWSVGVVGPEDFFLREIVENLRITFIAQILLGVFVLLFAILMVQAMRRGLDSIETETHRMRKFDFAPSTPKSAFADVKDALWNLELAKTAMRALSRFVPVALVRRLFEANQEPTLGSEPRELSMMFTDIEGFTTLVEREEPRALAMWLGEYFSTMTHAVHAEDGIVDKFIGDAVMALWNAPNPVEQHAVRACAAALRCLRETEALYDSPAWKGRPRLVTRFGLHVADVLVGHFGAPDRVSYTAIGDGVNLASRLEGLNKQFGTRILVSEAIESRARHAFAFRRLDRVAVKGKSQAVAVFELLGPLDAPAVPKKTCERYEQALEAYAQRDFAKACALLSEQPEDPPSKALHARCSELKAAPPGPEWDAVLHPEK